MSEREKIQQTIATLESQREILGDDVVDASIQALQRQLQALPPITGERSIQAEKIDGSAVSGEVDAEGDFVGRDKYVIYTDDGKKIAEEIALRNIDPQTAMGQYLTHLIAHHRYLQLQGIRSGGKLVHIPLDHIYITLQATGQRTPSDEDAWSQAESQRAPGERHKLPADRLPERLTINDALAQHKRLVVLGDPGSGKTTLLRYLTLIYARDLAGESGLVGKTVGVAESGYLPIWLELRRIGAFLRAHGDVATEGHRLLLQFYRTQLQNEGVALPSDFFEALLAEGRTVVLLDGLDEVADPALRRRVSRLVENLTRAYPKCRYMVTSRIVGYQGTARLGAAYTTTTTRDFSLENIRAFLRRWHRLVAVGQMGDNPTAERFAQTQTEQLLTAIEKNERIRELAINPLMLTVIALVHRDRVILPDRRAELYDEAIAVLLGKWEEAKGVASEMGVLEDRPFDAGDRRLLLQQIALQMHEQNSKEIEAEALRHLLFDAFHEMVGENRAAERATDRFLQVIQERTGLLVARGEGVYAFSHLTFQEYLAALAVVARDDYVAYALQRCGDPWWREVILLAVGQLSMSSKERTSRLIEAIAEGGQNSLQNLALAADCLRDAGKSRVYTHIEAMVVERIQAGLQKPPPFLSRWRRNVNLEDWIRQRSLAATALGRLEGYCWDLPHGEPEWVTIPEGEFWMGSEDGEDNEKPRHQVTLPTYQIARVPVTNAQYLLFVQATNHKPPYHWQDGHIPKGLESHPVTQVTWHDAMAYCAWLSEVTGKQITLPSEAQWEKAARGADGRTYPWGNAFDRLKCNSEKLGIQTTTPVGIFPEGASPYGVLDLSGNVWEWTCTRWGYAYPYQAEDGRENLEFDKDKDFVMRGGSWYTYKNWARCAFRFGDPHRLGGYYGGFRVCVSVDAGASLSTGLRKAMLSRIIIPKVQHDS